MKILITGAAGMLAAEVIPVLIKEDHEVVQTDIHQRLPVIGRLDIREKDEVFTEIERIKPDYVFHLGAETNVDLCEQEPEHAFRSNATGTENMALACKEFDIKMLYISTTSVFSGDKLEPYNELDTPNPVNVYAKSKLEGERTVQKLLSEYFIIRAGWMIGGWELDKKFVYKIVQQLKSGKKELTVVNDKFGSPTFTKDFAANLMNVINTEKYDLYHMTNKGTCSRFDMAVKIVEFMGLENKVKVNPVSSDQYPLPAPRPRSEMAQNYRLDLLGLNNMPFWQDSLHEYINVNRDKQ